MEFFATEISTGLRNHLGLDQNLTMLKRKLEELNGVKEDNESIKSVELRPRKKLRKAVEIWFQNVERINGEILNLENRVRETNVVSVSRVSLGAEVLRRIEEVEEHIEKGKSFNGLVIEEPQWIGQVLSTTTLSGEVPKKVMEEIWAYLMEDGVSKIGVWGMGGVGKTTIMKLINNQLLKETEKFDLVIWITVSKEMNVARLQNGIARAMKASLSEDDDETIRAGMLYEMLKRKGKYVLILDDVWNTFSLEEVGIPEPSNGSKIILTTRSLNVCQYFGAQKVRLHTLPKQDAWNLFLQKVGEDVSDHPDLLPFVKSVAEECDGLPLAIVTIASGMKGVRDIHEWRNALNELRRFDESVSGSNEKIFQQLRFSYDRLGDEKVRNCFLYLALFPEDCEVKKVELIERWIDEGFLEEMGRLQAKIDKGHSIMNKLTNNCLFQTGRTLGCVKLHDLMRDLALRITSARPRFLVKAGMQLKQIPAVQEWTDDLGKVSFQENWELGIPSNMSPPKCGMLTTLLLGSRRIKSIPESFFKHMRGIKVLDLSDNPIESLPTSIVNLKNLRTLLLKYCQKLKRLPSFSNLQALRKLNLASTGINDLPHGLERLVNLRYLDLNCAFYRREVADGLIANLTSLQHLKVLSFVNGEEIGRLEKLEYFQGLFYDVEGLNNFVQALCDRTRRPSEYFVYVGDECEDGAEEWKKFIAVTGRSIPVDGIKIPTDVEQVCFEKCYADLLYKEEAFFSCFIIPVPHGIFSSLSTIEVRECKKIKKLFSFNWIEQNLKNLSELSVMECDEMEEIIASESNAEEGGTATIQFTLPKLKYLTLWVLPRLRSICSANRVMVCDSIEDIIVYDCPELRRMPLHLPSGGDGRPSLPPSLRYTEIKGCEMMKWDHPNIEPLLRPS